MRTVWKYTLRPGGAQNVEMPIGAKVLTAREQGDDFCLWAMVESDEKEIEVRRFIVRGTGHPIDGAIDLEYIGTASFHGGGLIFHAFEVK